MAKNLLKFWRGKRVKPQYCFLITGWHGYYQRLEMYEDHAWGKPWYISILMGRIGRMGSVEESDGQTLRVAKEGAVPVCVCVCVCVLCIHCARACRACVCVYVCARTRVRDLLGWAVNTISSCCLAEWILRARIDALKIGKGHTECILGIEIIQESCMRAGSITWGTGRQMQAQSRSPWSSGAGRGQSTARVAPWSAATATSREDSTATDPFTITTSGISDWVFASERLSREDDASKRFIF